MPNADRYRLPPGLRSRIVPGINGLAMHVLEAGFETPNRPCVLLLHGFPELAYSWRKVMPPLAAAGFHVIAPDQRGYGSTTGWDSNYDGDLHSFHMLGLARDALALMSAFGYPEVAGVVGHDFGSPVAAWCALVRPDVFRSVVMMSAPFAGPPALPSGAALEPREENGGGALDAAAGRCAPVVGGAREFEQKHPCRTRSARSPAQALSVVLRKTRSEREHVALPARCP